MKRNSGSFSHSDGLFYLVVWIFCFLCIFLFVGFIDFLFFK